MEDMIKTVTFLQTMRASKPWTNQEEMQWWASFLLKLTDSGEYDLLMKFLTIAQEEGYLSNLRQAAEQIVRERKTMPKGGVKKARARKSVAFRAVAA